MSKPDKPGRVNVKGEVLAAEERIRAHVRETPLEESLYLSGLANCDVHLKLENLQITGSFKLRGAANKLLSLSAEELERGTVTASTGNHGAAFAYMLKRLGARGTIFLPENAAPAKVEGLRLYGAELQFSGDDCVKAEEAARAEAERSGRIWVSPYNDAMIVGGQGTVAVELERQLGEYDAILVPVGGGGLAGGIAGYLKEFHPRTEVIGCQPINSAVMYESVKAGRILDIESLPTLSDGSSGGIEHGSITFEICREHIDDFILLSEEEIAAALRLVIEKHYMLIEGSAALPVAALLQQKEKFEGKRVVLVFSGAHIGIDTLKTLLTEK